MTKKQERPADPDDQWHHHVRETYRFLLPVNNEHAWTAIAREPLASDWEGPELPRGFPAKPDFARAVLVAVVERGWPTVIEWRSAQDQEREQVAEAVAQESQVSDLLRRGNRPPTDEEQTATMPRRHSACHDRAQPTRRRGDRSRAPLAAAHALCSTLALRSKPMESSLTFTGWLCATEAGTMLRRISDTTCAEEGGTGLGRRPSFSRSPSPISPRRRRRGPRSKRHSGDDARSLKVLRTH